MFEIINSVKNALIEGGAENVYSEYDALPLRNKGRYTVIVGVSGYEEQPVLYYRQVRCVPIKLTLVITLLAPLSETKAAMYEIYAEKIQPVLDGMSGMYSRISGISFGRDDVTGRMSLRASFEAAAVRDLPQAEEGE